MNSISSVTAQVQISFHNKWYFGIYFHCYSDRFEEEKLYQVYCNATSTINEFHFKIPLEGTKKCVQVSNDSVYLKAL